MPILVFISVVLFLPFRIVVVFSVLVCVTLCAATFLARSPSKNIYFNLNGTNLVNKVFNN